MLATFPSIGRSHTPLAGPRARPLLAAAAVLGTLVLSERADADASSDKTSISESTDEWCKEHPLLPISAGMLEQRGRMIERRLHGCDPPPVKTFIVFFDFDKSNVTDKAQEVIAEAVKTAKGDGMVKVMVTGHTDTAGSDTYNQALSERRAQAVKDEMIHDGMDGSVISIQGKSFHDPLVPTGPGVHEPQNRRAVIDLGG